MLYGKWRPRGFDEVVGQDHIVVTLRNALATGQVAHAYLFTGPRGTGKTTTARILARAVNCAQARDDGNPCDRCASCQAIRAGAALDLIEMDAASNRGIEDIRELRDKIAFAPADLEKKVYLLDEVHMLTAPAFNALLKTLEEPPPHAIFILATTEPHDVPATIVSRCQRFDFRRVPIDAIVERLRFIGREEGFAFSDEGLRALAIQARGGMRDAITLMEQVVSRYGPAPSTDDVLEALGLIHDERSTRLAEAIVAKDLGVALALAREVAEDGLDVARFTRETIDVLRGRLLEAARGGDGQVVHLARAVSELAQADFRRDPASPVPLEVACAAAIVGPAPVAVAAGGTADPGAASQPARRQTPTRRRGAPQQDASPELSKEERFLKELYHRCRMANPLLAAWLNGSCDVVSMEGDRLELGFYRQLHMQKVDTDCRVLVEQVAEELLGRPVTLAVSQLERTPQTQRQPRGGHLVEAARAIGATPVRKDDETDGKG